MVGDSLLAIRTEVGVTCSGRGDNVDSLWTALAVFLSSVACVGLVGSQISRRCPLWACLFTIKLVRLALNSALDHLYVPHCFFYCDICKLIGVADMALVCSSWSGIPCWLFALKLESLARGEVIAMTFVDGLGSVSILDGMCGSCR